LDEMTIPVDTILIYHFITWLTIWYTYLIRPSSFKNIPLIKRTSWGLWKCWMHSEGSSKLFERFADFA